MKISNIIVIGLIFIFYSAGYGQESVVPVNPNYDAELAKKVGANDNGMKTFVFALLKPGTVKIEDAKERKTLLDGHMANINRLAKEGKLVLAGPFFDNPDFLGIFIFDVQTIEDAKKLVETDPAVKSGMFAADLRLWFGTAALLEIPKLHDKITKKKL